MKKLTKCKCKRCRRPRYKVIVVRENKKPEVKLKPPHAGNTPYGKDYEQMCPNCGEFYSTLYYIKRGELNKGVNTGVEITRPKGLLGFSSQTYQTYHCFSCGHIWEMPT